MNDIKYITSNELQDIAKNVIFTTEDTVSDDISEALLRAANTIDDMYKFIVSIGYIMDYKDYRDDGR